jgi:hypothetical protein
MRTGPGISRVVWLLPAAALLACSKGQESSQAAMAQGGAQAMAPTPVTLASKNNSGITGTVSLAKTGDSTTIAVTLNGGTPGATYPSHIHAGHCDQPGAVVTPLTSVAVGPDHSGTSMTTVATSVLDSARQQYGSLLEQSHQPDGTPAACGEIPASMP